MKKNEIDYKLSLFLKHVEKGKNPPKSLMDFIADGIREFQKGGKPWQVKTGRKSFGESWADHSLALQCHALNKIKCERARIAIITDLNEKSEKTLSRCIQRGGGFAAAGETGNYDYEMAIEELLENSKLKPAEIKELKLIHEGILKELSTESTPLYYE